MSSAAPPQALDEQRLAHEIFRADTLPARERFAVWRDAVLPLFDCTPKDSDSFTATLEGYDLQQTFVSVSSFSALRYRRNAHHAPAQGSDHLLIQMYLEGGYVGENGLHPMRVAAGDICLLDLAHPLATQTEASRVLTVVMPRALLKSTAPRQTWTPGAVLRAGSPMANILGHHLWTVWQNLPRASAAEADAINRLVAGAVAGAFATGTAETATTTGATFSAISEYILRHLESRTLTPAYLCRRFGCSRSQLYRMFLPAGGIAGLIRRARLKRCRDELIGARAEGVRITDVAVRWGFDNQSHFCRLFRREFGMSPGDALELGRSSQQSPILPAARRHSRYEPAFQRWLQQLHAA